jgi:hypothetical protein
MPGDSNLIAIQDRTSRPRRRSPPIQLTIRLYPGLDDDLIGWLNSVGHGHHGTKGLAVKEALRRGCRADQGLAMATASVPSLAEIRQVVEAALTSALGRSGCVFRGGRPLADATETETEGSEEAEGVLEAFGRSLVLG